MPIKSNTQLVEARIRREEARKRKVRDRAAEYEQRRKARRHFGQAGRYNPYNNRWKAQ